MVLSKTTGTAMVPSSNTDPSNPPPKAIGGLLGGGKQCRVEQQFTRLVSLAPARKQNGCLQPAAKQTFTVLVMDWLGNNGGKTIMSGVNVGHPVTSGTRYKYLIGIEVTFLTVKV